jgi:uncharacterized protein (DUF1330 family)
MYKINERVEVQICSNIGFDRAADEAYNTACQMFGVDDDGYCKYVEDWNRSTDMIIIEFKSYRHTGSMVGQDHIYTFVAWIERNEE